MLADFVTHSIGVHSRLLKTAGAIPLKAGHPVNLIERHEARASSVKLPSRPTGPPPRRVVYGEGHSRPAQPHGNFDLDRA
jgi:hypothetical protein